jgi:hypothetical protein
MKINWIPVAQANTKRELSKIKADTRLKGVRLKVKDIFKAQPKDKEYFKFRIKQGLDKRYGIYVPSSYYDKK